jgi:hypothetical protein
VAKDLGHLGLGRRGTPDPHLVGGVEGVLHFGIQIHRSLMHLLTVPPICLDLLQLLQWLQRSLN